MREFKLDIIKDFIKLSHVFYDGQKIYAPQMLLEQQDFTRKKIEKIFRTLPSSVRSIQDVLDIFFKDDSILKHVLSTRISLYEGSAPYLLSVHHNRDTLKSLLLRGLAPAHQTPVIHRTMLKEGNARLPLKIAEKISPMLHRRQAKGNDQVHLSPSPTLSLSHR